MSSRLYINNKFSFIIVSFFPNSNGGFVILEDFAKNFKDNNLPLLIAVSIKIFKLLLKFIPLKNKFKKSFDICKIDNQ